MDKLLTTAEVCAILRISRSTLHNYERRGLIRAVQVGGTKRFTQAAVQAVIKPLPTA